MSVPSWFPLPGFLVAAVVGMAMGMEPDARHRNVSILLLPVGSGIGLCLGATVAGPVASGAVFLGLCVATMVGFLFGTRGTLLGIASIVGYYGASTLRLTQGDLAVALASSLLAAIVAVVVLAVLLPERPRWTAVRISRSITVLADRALKAAHGVAAADGSYARVELVRRELGRLSAAVAGGRAHAVSHPEHWPEPLQRNGAAALGSFELHIERAADAIVAGYAADRVVTDPVEFATLTATGATGDLRSPPVPAAGGGRSLLSTAVQLLTAAALSVTVGTLISPRYWFWAVLAALVMLFGTSSASDALGKGWGRLVGTLLGLPVGALLAFLAGGHVWALLVLAVAAMFLQQYLAETSYPVSVFFLSAMLALIFAATGSADDVLALRLVETAAGSAVGAVVALVVLPTRTRQLLRGRALDVAVAAEEATMRLAAGAPQSDVRAAATEAHDRFLILTSEAAASRRGSPWSSHHGVLASQLALASVVIHELRSAAESYAAAPHPSVGTQCAAEGAVAALMRLRHTLAASRAPLADAVDAPSLPSGEDRGLADALRRLEHAARAADRALHAG